MNWEAIGAIGEILGAAGVIVTLGYLAFQLRQNNRHLAHEAQRALAHAVRENTVTIANNAEIWVKDQAGETLTAAEAIRMNMQWHGLLFGYQTAFQQLPLQEIEARANNFRLWFENTPSFRASWEQNQDTFQSDFVRFMEQNVVSR